MLFVCVCVCVRVLCVCVCLCAVRLRVQVRNFLGSLKKRGSQMRSVQVAVETIMLNQRWMDANLPDLRHWL